MHRLLYSFTKTTLTAWEQPLSNHPPIFLNNPCKDFPYYINNTKIVTRSKITFLSYWYYQCISPCIKNSSKQLSSMQAPYLSEYHHQTKLTLTKYQTDRLPPSPQLRQSNLHLLHGRRISKVKQWWQGEHSSINICIKKCLKCLFYQTTTSFDPLVSSPSAFKTTAFLIGM